MIEYLPDKLFFRPSDIAAIFDVKIKTVYCWLETGKLDSIKIAGTVRIPRQAVIDAIKEGEK